MNGTPYPLTPIKHHLGYNACWICGKKEQRYDGCISNSECKSCKGKTTIIETKKKCKCCGGTGFEKS